MSSADSTPTRNRSATSPQAERNGPGSLPRAWLSTSLTPGLSPSYRFSNSSSTEIRSESPLRRC